LVLLELCVAIEEVDHQVIELATAVLVLVRGKQWLQLWDDFSEEIKDRIQWQFLDAEEQLKEGLLVLIIDVCQNLIAHCHD